MAYRIERKKYRPIFERAKHEAPEGITLSRRGNVQLIHPEDEDAKMEFILGWNNEIVTHLILQPNEKLSDIIQENKTEIQTWIGTKLITLFGDIPVPEWKI
jgi:hypothetical protein